MKTTPLPSFLGCLRLKAAATCVALDLLPVSGPWFLETIHLTRACTPVWASVYGPAQMEGASEGYAYFGTLLDTIDTTSVNGFAYITLRWVATQQDLRVDSEPLDPEEALSAWERLVASRPDIRARLEQADRVVEEGLFEKQLCIWDTYVRNRCRHATHRSHR